VFGWMYFYLDGWINLCSRDTVKSRYEHYTFNMCYS